MKYSLISKIVISVGIVGALIYYNRVVIIAAKAIVYVAIAVYAIWWHR